MELNLPSYCQDILNNICRAGYSLGNPISIHKNTKIMATVIVIVLPWNACVRSIQNGEIKCIHFSGYTNVNVSRQESKCAEHLLLRRFNIINSLEINAASLQNN